MTLPDGPIDIPADAADIAQQLQDFLATVLAQDFRVGIGMRRVGGEFTGEVALRVFLPEKLPPDRVSPQQLIPREFGGYLVDVDILAVELIVDSAAYAPLRGGIQISPPPVIVGDVASRSFGTAGAVVRRRSDGAKCLLTCRHVVGGSGTKVFQPAFHNPGSTIIGDVVADDPTFDCAIVQRSDPDTRGVISEIEEIGPVQGDSGVMLWQPVHKRGTTTGHTFAVTSDFLLARVGGALFHDLIMTTFPPGGLFADHGDSGSAVLNADDEVVALLYGLFGGNTGTGMATLIYHVKEALGVDIAVPPQVLGVDPDSALGTAATFGQVTIRGRGFVGPRVEFDGLPVIATVTATEDTIVVIPPLHLPGQVDVRVRNADGELSAPSDLAVFRYDQPF